MVNSPNLKRRRVPMSALVMPVEMGVLGAPPALASSPLIGADFLSELQCAPWPPPPTCQPARPAAGVSAGQESPTPLRPILAAPRHDATRRHCNKRVVFADARGLALVQTRIVSEPASLPMEWTLHTPSSLPPLLPPLPERPCWTLACAQPVADFSRFCERLERDSVALETAVCGAGRRTVTGVIRVKNLGFEKRVFVRATSDGWLTSRDWSAIYIPPIDGAAGQVASFDRFSFEVETPNTPDSDQLEFCVCFQCISGEFWDNNGGENYVMHREHVSDGVPDGAPRDVYSARADSKWAYFSSWEDDGAEIPYW